MANPAQTTPTPEMAWHHTPTKLTGLTASQLRLAVKAGQLPPPVVIGQRLRGWKVSDLLKLVTPATAQ